MVSRRSYAATIAAHGIPTIDLVCVNLYPFRETVAKADVTLAEEDAVALRKEAMGQKLGDDELDFDADPGAVVIWFSDDPSLNEQTHCR